MDMTEALKLTDAQAAKYEAVARNDLMSMLSADWAKIAEALRMVVAYVRGGEAS